MAKSSKPGDMEGEVFYPSEDVITQSRLKDWDTLAEKAEWLDGQWWFYGVQEQEYDNQGNPVGKLTPAVPDPTSVLQMPFIGDKPTDFVNDPKQWEYYTFVEMVRYLRSHKGLTSKDVAEKTFDLHRRLAMPWACLIVTLFGIPAGNKSARQNMLSGVFIAASFFLGFYALSQVGAYLGIRQVISAWLGAWLSNMVFVVAGIYLLIRIR